jgi:Na+-transporting NADH:ubiquinone oxidoreductase subunit NqrB
MVIAGLKKKVIKSKFKMKILRKNIFNPAKFNLQFLKIISKLALPCWSKKNFEKL